MKYKRIVLVGTLLVCMLLYGCSNETKNTQGKEEPAKSKETVVKEFEENKEKVEKATLYEGKYPLPEGVTEDMVYGIEGSGEYSFEFDVSYPAIIERSDLIAVCKVLSLDKTYIKENWPIASTSYYVNIQEVIKGDSSALGKRKVVNKGGFVSIQEYMDNHHESVYKKLELDKLSETDRQKLMGLFPDPYYQPLLVGHAYLLFLKNAPEESKAYNENDYIIIGLGYGIFRYNETNRTFSNDLNEGVKSMDDLVKRINQ